MFARAFHVGLSWARSFQFIPSHHIPLRSILILSTHLRLGLPSGLLPSGFATNILYAFLFSLIHALNILIYLRTYKQKRFNRPPFYRPQAISATCDGLLNVTCPPFLWRSSPATAPTSRCLVVITPATFPQARCGTGRLIRGGWERNLGASKRTWVPCNWESIRAVRIEIRLVCSVAGRGGLRLRAYRSSLRQNRKKVMLTTTRTLSDTRVFNYGLFCL
jgi:hypothetical protein